MYLFRTKKCDFDLSVYPNIRVCLSRKNVCVLTPGWKKKLAKRKFGGKKPILRGECSIAVGSNPKRTQWIRQSRATAVRRSPAANSVYRSRDRRCHRENNVSPRHAGMVSSDGGSSRETARTRHGHPGHRSRRSPASSGGRHDNTRGRRARNAGRRAAARPCGGGWGGGWWLAYEARASGCTGVGR